MRLFLFAAVLCFSLAACNNDSQTDTKTVTKEESNKQADPFKEKKEKVQQIVKRTNYPDWLVKKYGIEKKQDGQVFGQKIISYTEMEKPIRFVINERNSELCSTTYLTTLYDRTKSFELIIAQNCDQDQSIPNYNYKVYERLNETEFRVLHIIESATQEAIDTNGRFKENFNWDNTAVKRDTIPLTYKVLPSGKIKQILR
jgi:hypothetical protein